MVIKKARLNLRFPVVYLGFEYRSAQKPERRGFAVTPAAMYVDECLEIVHLHNAKPVVTPLMQQTSANLHDDTTVCDQAEHALFRASACKLQYITGVRPDLLFVTECLSYKLASPTLPDFDTCKEGAEIFEGNAKFEFFTCRFLQ